VRPPTSIEPWDTVPIASVAGANVVAGVVAAGVVAGVVAGGVAAVVVVMVVVVEVEVEVEVEVVVVVTATEVDAAPTDDPVRAVVDVHAASEHTATTIDITASGSRSTARVCPSDVRAV